MKLTRRDALGAATLLPLIAGRSESAPREPFLRDELIFPLGALHSHASCIVECPNGDLLTCYYQGSGERNADDVRVLGSRLRKASREWEEPFVMADTPGFPDCNPCMIVDPRGKLWLFWVTIQANEWHTGLLKARVSSSYQRKGAPKWESEQVVHLKPGAEFTKTVHAAVEQDVARLESYPEPLRPRIQQYLELRRKNSADKYFMRVGWMPRAHPYILEGKRLILPLYSDGFDFSLMAITDDWGENWRVSLPLVGDGPVQPSIVRKRDGTLGAFFRDNGMAPKRVPYCESRDRGQTWGPVRDLEIPNPGAGLECIVLRDGRWLLVNNDTERGRHSLALSLSDDEGRTWPKTRHLVLDKGPEPVTGAYPSLLEARDGTIHCSYTYTLTPSKAQKDSAGRPLRESIKHAHINLEWVERGD
jgi:hypothetical protein